MKTELHKIEDGQGVLIPKTFLEECGIKDAVDISMENGRIIIKAFKSKKDRPENFVNHVMKFCNEENKAALAALKCADNLQKQDKSLSYLATFYIDFDNQNEYLPYATIAAAIAKADAKQNGHVGIGRAIARCYETVAGSDNKKEVDPQAKTKIRRLLACDSTEEACRVLRPLFSLIDAKGLAKTIDYISLLRALEGFHIDWRREKIKQDWARDFYKRLADKEANDE
jgi:CRISPR system Cascade subunit CasB